MSVIGLTGGIATGKSTVSKLFKKRGLTVLDADEIAHHAYDPNAKTYKAIINRFDCLENGLISRKKLGTIVFNDEQARHDLEDIIHPYVRQVMLEGIKKAAGELIVLDVPLLYESHFDELCDLVVVVTLDEKTEIKRLMKRNNLSYEEAIKRINAQMPLSEKKKRANYIIDNSGDLKDLEHQVDEFLRKVSGHAEK